MTPHIHIPIPTCWWVPPVRYITRYPTLPASYFQIETLLGDYIGIFEPGGIITINGTNYKPS